MPALLTAPVVLFAYRRPEHLRATLKALAQNTLAQETELTIYCDGPRQGNDLDAIKATRSIAKATTGFKAVNVVLRDVNLGLAASIMRGVEEQLISHDRIIVVEDDILTSPHFLTYMNQALHTYQDDPEVWCIHGYQFPIDSAFPETFFLRGAECWGWATWRRAWKGFIPDSQQLIDDLAHKKLLNAFNLEGGYNYTSLLKQQATGKVDSWAIRWRASAFAQGGLCLWPGKSLVSNIGHDDSGQHCESTSRFHSEPSRDEIPIVRIPLAEDSAARDSLRNFFITSRPPLRQRIVNKLRRLWRSLR